MSTVYTPGEPPSDGWWPTRVMVNGEWHMGLRWFNGRDWSIGVDPSTSAKRASMAAHVIAVHPNWAIEWAERPASWPARSRT
jgi:hypothetical protein